MVCLEGIIGDLFYTFIDESGSDTWPGKSVARKYSLFIEAAVVVDSEARSALINKYIGLLNKKYGNGFTIKELFEIYQKVTGKPGELKGGYISGLKGPFRILRELSEKKAEEIKDRILMDIARILRDSKCDIIVIVIDKYRLKKLIEKTNKLYDIRLLALDFLFTRIAMLMEKKGFYKTVVVHDETPCKKDIVFLLETLHKQGYFYNPKLKWCTNYHLITTIEFQESYKEPLLQFADLAAYIVFKARSGRNKEYYKILAGSPRFKEVIYPH